MLYAPADSRQHLQQCVLQQVPSPTPGKTMVMVVQCNGYHVRVTLMVCESDDHGVTE
jgi:hypothetical protein